MSRYCKIEGCGRPCEGRTDQCASHNSMDRRAERKTLKDTARAIDKLATSKFKQSPIKRTSNTMVEKLKEYSRLKKEFIKGKTCPEYPNLPVEDIHHMRGREGSLLLDTRYWMAVSRKAHIKITNNPAWARSKGYNLKK